MKLDYKKIAHQVAVGSMSTISAVAAFPAVVSAQIGTDVNKYYPPGYQQPGNLANNDPVTILRNLINFGMGFLGLVAVVIILWSGFEWMTSAGDEKKVDTAKKRMISGVIGLAIILAAWSVAYYVVGTLASVIVGGQ